MKRARAKASICKPATIGTLATVGQSATAEMPTAGT
jgi:hypothetical protein